MTLLKPFLLALAACAFTSLLPAAVILGPTNYRQTSDSPFYSAFQRGELYLEDFTVGQPLQRVFQTPFVTSSAGHLGSASGYYSVDGDDGILDDFGRFGGSYTFPEGNRAPDGSFVKGRFDFFANGSGTRPFQVGVVVTHILSYREPVRLRVYDEAGTLLADTGLLDFPDTLDNVRWPFQWFTGDAQFVGFLSDVPIATLTIDGAFAIDHLQYSFTAIPEPASAALLGAGALISLRRRRTLKTA